MGGEGGGGGKKKSDINKAGCYHNKKKMKRAHVKICQNSEKDQISSLFFSERKSNGDAMGGDVGWLWWWWSFTV